MGSTLLIILAPLLIQVGRQIFELLFKYLEKKYSADLMDLAYKNVNHLQRKKEAKILTSDECELIAVEVLADATKASPPISKTWRKFINLVAYGKWIAKNRQGIFASWFVRDDKFKTIRRLRNKKQFTRMGLYLSQKDRT